MCFSRLRLVAPALCACLTAPSATAKTVISEIFYDAVGSDAGQVFVELFGTPGDELAGLLLEGVNGAGGTVYKSVSLNGVIPEDGVFVIADLDGGGTAVSGADQVADIDFQNGPDSVVLRSATQIIDAVGYGSFSASELFAGEGAPAADAPAGSSLARFNPWQDTGNNAVDFVVSATPTPGVLPSIAAVPLPASLWLMVSGLLAMVVQAGRGRRVTNSPGSV